jgi:hypothetical protein
MGNYLTTSNPALRLLLLMAKTLNLPKPIYPSYDKLKKSLRILVESIKINWAPLLTAQKNGVLSRPISGVLKTLWPFNPTTCLSQLMEYSIMTYANYTNR